MNAFVARQPIFDGQRAVRAYELLFRDGFDKAFDFADGTAASSQVMSNTMLLFGIRDLTGGTRAFINLTPDVLLKGYAELLPVESVVLELVEDTPIDSTVIEACRKLRQRGFEFALDDVVRENRGPLFELATFIKVDFLATDEATQRSLARHLAREGVTLVAEKVEDYTTFLRARGMGYHYFQGFFFAEPETLCRRDVSPSKQHCLELLREVNRPGLELEELHDLIRRDVALSYRLLRYLNSAHFGLHVEIQSIRHAIVLLGEREIKRWATLISLASLGDGKPSEILVTTLTRARFLELLAGAIDPGQDPQEFFLMGMLSLLDALLDRPLAECLRDVPIAKDIEAALNGGGGRYRDTLDLVLSYERAAWDTLIAAATRLGFSPTDVPTTYLQATKWAREAVAESALMPAASKAR